MIRRGGDAGLGFGPRDPTCQLVGNGGGTVRECHVRLDAPERHGSRQMGELLPAQHRLLQLHPAGLSPSHKEAAVHILVTDGLPKTCAVQRLALVLWNLARMLLKQGACEFM